MNYLYAAYAATWLIHAAYIVFLVNRHRRLKLEKAELERN